MIVLHAFAVQSHTHTLISQYAGDTLALLDKNSSKETVVTTVWSFSPYGRVPPAPGLGFNLTHLLVDGGYSRYSLVILTTGMN